MSPRPALLDRRHLRRRANLAAARLRATLCGGLAIPVLFLHLPKCGGTSLTAALSGTVALPQRIGVIDALATRRAAAVLSAGRDDLVTCHEDLDQGAETFALRKAQMLTLMAQDCRLVHGHVFYDPDALAAMGGRYALVTMMRDPVARALSNYRMAVRAGVIPDDPEGWLSGPVGRRMAQSATRYLSGQHTIDNLPTALDAARHALDRFALVGVLEDMEGFAADFARRFGIRPSIPRLNVGNGPAVSLTDGQRARLQVLTAPDRKLYARALARIAADRGKSGRTEQSTLQNRVAARQASP